MKRLLILTILTGLLACASYQSPPPTERADEPVQLEQEKLMPYPLDAVWTALADLLESRRWTIASQDRAAGRISTEYFNLTDGSQFCGCQSGRRSQLSDYRAQLALTVKRVTANGTNVTIYSECDAVDTGRRGQQARVDCSSNGRLESEIFAGIDSVIAAR